MLLQRAGLSWGINDNEKYEVRIIERKALKWRRIMAMRYIPKWRRRSIGTEMCQSASSWQSALAGGAAIASSICACHRCRCVGGGIDTGGENLRAGDFAGAVRAGFLEMSLSTCRAPRHNRRPECGELRRTMSIVMSGDGPAFVGGDCLRTRREQYCREG